MGESRVTDTAIIPYESFLKQKLLQYFKEFRIYGDCNKSIAEKCLYNEINKNMQNIDTIVIPEFAGFYLSNEEISFYAGNNYENKALWGIVPDAIKNRRMLMSDITASELSEPLVRLMSDPLQSFLITCRIVGLISGLFKSIGVTLNQMLIVSSVSHNALKTVVSYLRVFNRPAFDVYSVDTPNGRLNKELKSTNGEVFVVSDISLCSNDKKRTETLDLLIKDMEIDETLPHLIAVVSNAAQYIVPVENQILVTLDDDFLSMSNEELKKLQLFFEKVDSCVIQYVCNNHKDVLAYLKQKTDLMCRHIKDNSNSNALISYSVIVVTGALLNMIFGVELMTHDTVEYAYSTIIKSKQSENGNEYAVLNEFSSVLNKIISEGTLTVIPYSDDMQYRKGSNMAILKNDLIFIEGMTLNNILMPEMTVCSNLTHTIKELENVNVVSATNNNTHPIKITNVYGIVEHVSMYAFRYYEVLNSANIEFLENGTNNDFWISKNELPESFIPLVCTQHTVAGRKSEYNRNENCHISITGKSGEGKTVFMSQVLAGCHKNNDKIIVFDSSGSFSRKELSRNLSEDYVTYISIREIIRNKFQFIMDIKLEELKPRDIQAAINIDAQRLGYKSIKNAYGLLLAVMRANDISINLRSIRLPKKEITTRKLPTADEVYSVGKGTNSELPVLLAMWLSLRIGEVAGLQFQDVDEENMSIYVRREIVRTDEGWTLVNHCKTVTSTRYVNLPEHILRLIKAIPHQKDTDFLFTVNPNTIRKRFKKLLKANNMDIRFHDLRHIFAITTAMLNIPEKYAMEMGGWSTPDVYKNVYQETFDSERVKADVAVDTYFNSIISNEGNDLIIVF